jgi:hypothetical protein
MTQGSPLVSPEFAGRDVPADRRQRTGGLAFRSVKPFQAGSETGPTKHKAGYSMAYTERPSCPGRCYGSWADLPLAWREAVLSGGGLFRYGDQRQGIPGLAAPSECQAPSGAAFAGVPASLLTRGADIKLNSGL